MLVLASSSPRRRELLTRAGIEFTIVNADIPEDQHEAEPPLDYSRRLAREKAEAVLQRLPAGPAQVLGADTIVVIHGNVLGKPEDNAQAHRMLRMLSGHTHDVITAVCLLTRNAEGHVTTDLRHESTKVHFRPLSDLEINAYISTREPFDKAGAYAIQGGASAFVASCDGDHDNVVGLPVKLVQQMLRGTGAH
jgi:septum formation protein